MSFSNAANVRRLIPVDRCPIALTCFHAGASHLFSDWQKTEEQKRREKLLLDELVDIVNKRDELVQHLDSHEQA